MKITEDQRKIARKNNIPERTVRQRLKSGWSEERALSEPIHKGKSHKVKRERKPKPPPKIASMERTDIVEFAKEIGLSYGEVTAYRHMGLSDQEIKEKHGKTYEKTTHRWAKKDEDMGRPKKVVEEVKEIKETAVPEERKEKASLFLIDSENIYQSQNKSFKLTVRKNTMTISKGSYAHMRITADEAKELSKALAEICAK